MRPIVRLPRASITPEHAPRARTYVEQRLSLAARSDGSRVELAEARRYLASGATTALPATAPGHVPPGAR